MADAPHNNQLRDGNVIPRSGRKMEVLQWDTLSPAVQVKLLFLLDTGEVTSQDTDYSDDIYFSNPAEAQSALPSVLQDRQHDCPSLRDTGGVTSQNIDHSGPSKKVRDAFLSVLQDRQHSFACVTEVLRDRIQHLLEYPFISLSAGTLAADLSVRKDDEDLLTLVHACRHLRVEYRYLEDKIKKVQEKLSLTEEEMEGNLFIYSENLRMLRLCDALPARQVTQLLALIMEDKTLREFVAIDLEVFAAMLEHPEGLKETLFFYLIRTLELNNKLNSIYSNKLKALLEQLQDQMASEEERHKLSEAITSLGDYPGGGRLAGHCVVFCVTHERDGAQADIDKVDLVFGRCLGYTVHIVENPDKEKLEECFRTLQKRKYKFYDSIVCWFMCHGSEDTLMMADDFSIERQTIIQVLSEMDSLMEKPLIIFLVACQGSSYITVTQNKRGMLVMDDHEGSNVSLRVVPSVRYPLSAYHRMDRLVASSTLPQQWSFRHKDKGSVYVDTVCHMMEQHRGQNITQVLERVTNTMHQILFSCEGESDGVAKQACCYESTLQKTFRVP